MIMCKIREMMHERDPGTGLRFANPLRKRTAKLRNWSGLESRVNNLLLLDHALLREKPRALVEALAAMLGREPLHDYGPVATYKGNGFRAYTPTPYPPLSRADDAFIEENLDRAVEARFGLA